MSKFQYNHLRQILSLFLIGIAIAMLSPGIQAQTVYRPMIRVTSAGSSSVFSYGLGALTCSRFIVQTYRSTSTSAVDRLLVDISCTDNPGNNNSIPAKSIVAYYNGSMNVGANNNTAVLECRGPCNPNFSTLTIGNLSATVTIKRPNCSTTQPGCVDTKAFGGNSNFQQPLELQIIRELGASAVFFRSGIRRTFPSNPNGNIFNDNFDPGAPRASRYAGGAALPNRDLRISER